MEQVFFGLILTFFEQRFASNLPKGDKFEAYQPNRETVF